MVDGYSQVCVRINLDNNSVKREKLSEEFLKTYIGGYGFIAKVLWDEVVPGSDPFDPRNPLVFAIGPVPGTILPTSSKYAVGAKSPASRRIGFGISSGSVGAQMRRCGIDMIIITGKAPEPVYLAFEDDIVNIIPCKDTLWGKDSWTVEDEIRNLYADQRMAVAAIGPGGENKVVYACITNDRNRQVGRTGMGAIMGGKNLKALAFKGTKSVTVAHRKEFLAKAKSMIKLANSDKTYKYRYHGTPINILVFNEIGVLPTKNFQTGYWEKADKISGQTMSEEWVTKKAACSQCPIACDHLCGTGPNDPDWPNVVSSVDFESIYALGSVCLVDHFPAIIKAIELCDRLGMDTMSGGVTIGWAMEAYEKGVITKAMLGDNPVYKDGLNWGNYKAMVQIIEDICLGSTEAGRLLGLGSRGAALKMGKDSVKYAMQIKGVEIPGYGLKGLTTASIGFATSLRGACHLRSGSYGPDIKGKFDRHTYDKLEERAKVLAANEANLALVDCLVICKFTRGLYKNFDEFADVYNMITGFSVSGKDLEVAGQRVHDLAKCFNIREAKMDGIESIDEDTLPWRNFNEGNLDGPTKGWLNDEEGFKKGIIAYYLERGWNEKGIPTEETLKARGLDFVIGKL